MVKSNDVRQHGWDCKSGDSAINPRVIAAVKSIAAEQVERWIAARREIWNWRTRGGGVDAGGDPIGDPIGDSIGDRIGCTVRV